MSIEIIKAEDNYFNDSTAIVSVDYNSIHNHIQYNITHYNNKPIDKISILANSLILIHENNVLVRGWHEIIESTQKKYTLTKWYAGDYYSIYHINTTVGTKTKAALHGDHAD
jgi:hypothetical protein